MTTQPPPPGPTLLGPQTNIAGDVNTGGGLFNAGTLNQYHFPAAGTPVRDPVPLAVALARLAELPTDHVPPIAALPAGSWLPLPANPHFVGRQPELLALAAALKGGNAAGITPGSATAATGLGGIGKTQLAAAFAHHYGHYFLGGVYWLSFADPAGVSAEVAQCAAWMSDLPVGVTHLPIPDQIQLVRRAWHEALPRLLIFDNCEDPALLEAWRPKSGGCRILLTSRHARWHSSQAVTTIAVGVLPRDESIALLRKFTPSPFGEGRGGAAPSPKLGEGWGGGDLDAIAAELGDLPLALHMAGSYLATVAYDLPPAAYLAALRRPSLLDHLSLTSADYSPTSHDLHVARTFALSYARLDDAHVTDAAARHLLACAACFAPGEAIPRALLRAAADLGTEKDAERAAVALTRLVNLGLLEEVPGGALRLHRLLQHFVASVLVTTIGAAQDFVESTVLNQSSQINNAGDPRPLIAWQPHLRHITDRTHDRQDATAAGLCNTLGFHLSMIGDYAGAQSYYGRALTIRQQVLGERHSDTAQSLNNLGTLLHTTGDYTRAQPYYERALAINEQVLGEMHPDTAQSLNNVGVLLQDTGNYSGARPYYERALTIRQQVLGEMHPDTAQSLNTLGALLRDTGDYAKAQPYYERALTIRQQVLGEMHPATARSLNNLGALLDTMGDYAGARLYCERALAINEQVLGEMHPDTAQSLNTLGAHLQTTGDYAGARLYYERALTIRQQVLGEMHPATARSLNNLGALLDTMGDYAGARLYCERALAINEQVLGEMHPDTAQSLNTLGAHLQTTGDYAGARLYYERALTIRQQVLGEMHPATARSLNNLGVLLQTTGDYAGARPYCERALAINEQVLGEMHPDTATSLNNLGVLAAYEGDKAAAHAYLQQALSIRESSLGTNHPDTQRARASLAAVRAELDAGLPVPVALQRSPTD